MELYYYAVNSKRTEEAISILTRECRAMFKNALNSHTSLTKRYIIEHTNTQFSISKYSQNGISSFPSGEAAR